MRDWQIKLLGKRQWITFWAIFLISLLVYSQTMARFPTATADSDELIGVSYVGGLLHPPGYPILRIVLYVFTNSLVWWPLVVRANMVAVLLGALVNAGLYILLGKYLQMNYR